MRRQAIGLAVLAAALAAPAWGDDKPAPDDEKLIGTWALTAMEFMDKKSVLAEGQGNILAFAKGGKVTSKKPGNPAEDGTYLLGPVKTPREIDVTAPSNEAKKLETIKALYKVDGDTFLMAVSPAGPKGDRPTSFDASKAIILTFKRQKP